MTVPFFTQTEWVEPDRSIDREHAVEMVDLMLQQFGYITLGVHGVRLALEVVVPHLDSVCALHPDHEIREGEAVVPNVEVLVPHIDDLRVYKAPGLVHFDIDEPDGSADLRRSDASPLSEPRLPVAQRLFEIIGDYAYPGRAWVAHGRTLHPKGWITQQADTVYGHAGKSKDSR